MSSDISVRYVEGGKLVYLVDGEGTLVHVAKASGTDKESELEFMRKKVATYQGVLTTLEEFYKGRYELSEDILDLAWEMYSSYHGSMGNAMILQPEIFKETYRSGNRNTEAWITAAKAAWTKVHDGR